MSSKRRNAKLFIPFLVLVAALMSAQAGLSATVVVNVVAFTTGAPFSATLTAGQGATLAIGMVEQNPFAGTPTILAINGDVITLSSQILPVTATLPAAVTFATPAPPTPTPIPPSALLVLTGIAGTGLYRLRRFRDRLRQ